MVRKREIWFEKSNGLSYVPCHWKGLAVIGGFAIPVVGVTILGKMVLDALGYRALDWLPFVLIFFPMLLSVLAIARRHS